jgi:hypothetical protein
MTTPTVTTGTNTDLTGVAVPPPPPPPPQQPQPQPLLSQQQTASQASKQAAAAKSALMQSTVNPVDNMDDSSTIKIGLPYPNNLKVEKRSETSLLVSWDPPTAPLPINQSIDTDNLYVYDLNEQMVNVQTYNLYLNHELHSVISGMDDRIAILEGIDLSVVSVVYYITSNVYNYYRRI